LLSPVAKSGDGISDYPEVTFAFPIPYPEEHSVVVTLFRHLNLHDAQRAVVMAENVWYLLLNNSEPMTIGRHISLRSMLKLSEASKVIANLAFA
jgi:hypothetical protein